MKLRLSLVLHEDYKATKKQLLAEAPCVRVVSISVEEDRKILSCVLYIVVFLQPEWVKDEIILSALSTSVVSWKIITGEQFYLD